LDLQIILVPSPNGTSLGALLVAIHPAPSSQVHNISNTSVPSVFSWVNVLARLCLDWEGSYMSGTSGACLAESFPTSNLYWQRRWLYLFQKNETWIKEVKWKSSGSQGVKGFPCYSHRVEFNIAKSEMGEKCKPEAIPQNRGAQPLLQSGQH